MAGVEEKVKAAWATRFGVGKAPEALIRACAEKTAGLDSWQADLEIDSLVDAHVRRHLAEKIGGLGAYMEKALKALDSRLSQMEGPDGVESVETGMRLAERLDLKLANRLAVMQGGIEQKLELISKKQTEAGVRAVLKKQEETTGALEKQDAVLEKLEKAMNRETRPEPVGWLRPMLLAAAGMAAGTLIGGFLVFMALSKGGISVW